MRGSEQRHGINVDVRIEGTFNVQGLRCPGPPGLREEDYVLLLLTGDLVTVGPPNMMHPIEFDVLLTSKCKRIGECAGELYNHSYASSESRCHGSATHQIKN